MAVAVRVACLIVLAACSKAASSCPTADEIAPGEDGSDGAIIARLCREDDWPEAVSLCLKGANRDEDAEGKCFRGLTKEQGKALRIAFDPDREQEDRYDPAQLKLDLDVLAKSAPTGCAGAADKVRAIADAYGVCPPMDALHAFGTLESMKYRLKELGKASQPQACDAVMHKLDIELSAAKICL